MLVPTRGDEVLVLGEPVPRASETVDRRVAVVHVVAVHRTERMELLEVLALVEVREAPGRDAAASGVAAGGHDVRLGVRNEKLAGPQLAAVVTGSPLLTGLPIARSGSNAVVLVVSVDFRVGLPHRDDLRLGGVLSGVEYVAGRRVAEQQTGRVAIQVVSAAGLAPATDVRDGGGVPGVVDVAAAPVDPFAIGIGTGRSVVGLADGSRQHRKGGIARVDDVDSSGCRHNRHEECPVGRDHDPVAVLADIDVLVLGMRQRESADDRRQGGVRHVVDREALQARDVEADLVLHLHDPAAHARRIERDGAHIAHVLGHESAHARRHVLDEGVTRGPLRGAGRGHRDS